MDLKLPKQRKMKVDAKIWKRTLAFIIDLLIINIIILRPFEKLITKTNPTLTKIIQEGQTTIPKWIIMMMGAIGIIMLMYFTLFEYYLKQTPGMKILKIAMKEQTTFLKCTIRNLFVIPIFPFTVLWIIEPIYLFKYKKRLLEKLTKTETKEEISI